MGDRNGLVYPGSPAVVAASAVAGYICSPTKYDDVAAKTAVRRPPPVQHAARAHIIDGFPATVKGRLLWLDKDNLNTDGIYAGKHTYNDALTPEQMKGLIFENYDPTLRETARAGDVIVSGLNFGTGSSREQAATALKYFGIPCVIATSFSETYKRNAFNNGFVCFECPGLVEFLRRNKEGRNGETKKTVVAGDIEVDYKASVVRFGGNEFGFAALSPVAQELVVAGGAEEVVKRRLAKQV